VSESHWDPLRACAFSQPLPRVSHRQQPALSSPTAADHRRLSLHATLATCRGWKCHPSLYRSASYEPSVRRGKAFSNVPATGVSPTIPSCSHYNLIDADNNLTRYLHTCQHSFRCFAQFLAVADMPLFFPCLFFVLRLGTSNEPGAKLNTEMFAARIENSKIQACCEDNVAFE
jgi:hypothetical protein